MCHSILPRSETDVYITSKKLGVGIFGYKLFCIEDGLLTPGVLKSTGPYRVETTPLPGTAIPGWRVGHQHVRSPQPVSMDIPIRRIITDDNSYRYTVNRTREVVAGMHIFPFPSDDQEVVEVMHQDSTLQILAIVAFFLYDVLFYDGRVVSVRELYIPEYLEAGWLPDTILIQHERAVGLIKDSYPIGEQSSE